ncbi:bis(5'-nucleosyl)-tetraphosphatase PrpE [Bacillus sp. BRMEA1]|uniref:bis(5'-nucleosyl)-tetraphosphatase PrpE n=1 Tax=Neobacillus endophyticus TaxID=2738405 RepID=UPI001565D761|nr:bis(5'-nucleosyl)-tetraphosphatase PrpE [Neobacillus endophyticus]NRD78449.1 bis(5'-nucleosyl)-tetraphosphatase PrpE [Neobacillus endophyticus]
MKIDIIGDIHGCNREFQELTTKIGYVWENGLPHHPENRVIGFVGDLTDRGPESLKVIEVVWELVFKQKNAYYAPGNHCNKLYRFFLGNKVQIAHGLETTVAEYESLEPEKRQLIRKKFMELYESAPLYLVLDQQKLIIAHAGIKQELIGKTNGKAKEFVLYGDITGEKHADGTPVRRDWAKNYHGEASIVYGHTPVKEPRIINNTYNIDTGAVFGGNLTALRYPEMETVSVPSTMPYVPEKFRQFD